VTKIIELIENNLDSVQDIYIEPPIVLSYQIKILVMKTHVE